MGPKVVNKNKNCVFNGPYAGRDLYITMYQDAEKGFVVTHNVNIKPVSYFTGREKELQELRQRIEEGHKSVLVSGMGGIGKTHICRKLFEEYLNKHANSEDIPFCHIGYIEYNGDMGSSLQNCLKYKEQDNPGQNQEAAWKELEYLAADGKLLLFVDNVNVTMKEDEGLKRLKNVSGAVVLTSRRTSFSKEFKTYKIGFLDVKQCKTIYEKIRYEDSGREVPEDEIPDLEYIIEKLAAMHTITVEFLAHLAKTKHWTVKKLRDELEDKGFQLEYKDEEDGLVNIQKSYETLYDLSGLTKAEKNILEAFSVFPYIPLAAETCNEWLLADAGASEDDDVLMGLYQKGWLQFDIVQESYALHPVFAQFIYEKCKPRKEKHLKLILSCQKCLEFRGKDSMLLCQKYIPFAESIIEKNYNVDRMLRSENRFYSSFKTISILNKVFVKSQEKKWERIVCLVFALVRLLSFIKQYKRAERWNKMLVNIFVDIYGEDNYIVALAGFLLVETYIYEGEYEKAENLCKKNIKIFENAFGKNHLKTINAYERLANVYKCINKYRKAETLYINIIKMRENGLGKNHSSIAYIYECLAHLYTLEEKYEIAERMQNKGIDILSQSYQENYLDIAYAYSYLGVLQAAARKYEEAEDSIKKSLTMYEKSLGNSHSDTMSSYYALAWVYRKQKKYKEAEKIYIKSIQIYKNVLGENHFRVIDCYNSLALTYYEHGKLNDALNYYFKGYYITTFILKYMDLKVEIDYYFMKKIYEELDLKGDFEKWLEEKIKESDMAMDNGKQ